MIDTTARAITLDHLGLVTDDLDRAEATFRRLGFALTPRSAHKAPLEPGGPAVPWGSGNHCAMFGRGYFEILGIVDPDRPHAHIARRLASHVGLHLLALGCADAEATRTALARRAIAAELNELQRDVPFGDGARLGRFRILRPEDGGFPETDLFFIEHLTPEVLWQPPLIDQPNGVVALAGATLCVPDPEATARRLANLVGREGAASGGARRFALDAGWIEVIDAAGFAARYPGVAPPVVPALAVCHLAVADPAATRAYLEARGLAPAPTADGFWLGPIEGAVFAFAAA